MEASGKSAIDRLLGIMRRLRDPDSGCPWDCEQTFESIAPHTLEEAHEVVDAIGRGEPGAIRDELGDLLFQVVFHAQMAQERGWFGFDEVAESIGAKLVRRHPHVFGEPAAGLSVAEQARVWEDLKALERESGGQSGALAGVAASLPALTRATKLGRRAGRVGFDWPDIRGVRAKVDEERRELEEAIEAGESIERRAEELGDLLFATANWSRHLGIDPEAALRAANRKFEQRFEIMESLVCERGLVLADLSLEEWEALWSEAKER